MMSIMIDNICVDKQRVSLVEWRAEISSVKFVRFMKGSDPGKLNGISTGKNKTIRAGQLDLKLIPMYDVGITNIAHISVFNALSNSSSLVAAVLLQVKRGRYHLNLH